ncbi:MAG: hypothetical protein V8Q91_16980 [Bilophila wadsworthia]|uniref:hypothetical protein n=1 Tax=Bilophila wadsworthia TaxID=35833 RepID=UPI00300EEB55
MTNDDLEAVVWEGLDGVGSSPRPAIRMTSSVLTGSSKNWKRRRGIPVGTVEISMLLETAKGVVNASRCCMASSRNVNAKLGAA